MKPTRRPSKSQEDQARKVFQRDALVHLNALYGAALRYLVTGVVSARTKTASKVAACTALAVGLSFGGYWFLQHVGAI